ncbi:MAG: hypothetical protein ACW976_00755 [Candidatus Ranarchaeia archaeon]|jgi:hypothetical protein
MRVDKKVKRVLVGIPHKHKHIRTIIEFESGNKIILTEAEMANISRSFFHVLTHPLDKAVELDREHIEGKAGFAPYQLLNTNRPPEEIQNEIVTFLSESH